MEKRILCILMTVALLMTLIPLSAFAVIAPDEGHDLIVKDGDAKAIAGTDYEWDTDDQNKLIIKNINLTVSGTTTKEYIEVAESVNSLIIEDLTINAPVETAITFLHLYNDTFLESKGENSFSAYTGVGINAVGNVKIVGEGDLSLAGESGSTAIVAAKTLTLDCHGTVTADGGVSCDEFVAAVDTGKAIIYGDDNDHGAINANALTSNVRLKVTGSAAYKANENDIAGKVVFDGANNCAKTGSAVSKSVLFSAPDPVMFWWGFDDSTKTLYLSATKEAVSAKSVPHEFNSFLRSRYELSTTGSYYEYKDAPWSYNRYDITTVEFLNDVAPVNTDFWFCEMHSLKEIKGIEHFDTSNVKSMNRMFSDCKALTSLELSGLDTSNVTDMSWMFDGCYALKSLNLSGLDTSNVTDMSFMFHSCNALESLDLSGLDTSNVTDMHNMFEECFALKSIDLSGLDTSNVTDMSSMFLSCHALESLDLGSFDTSKVTNMISMFCECHALTALNLSGFDTSCVSDVTDIFGSHYGGFDKMFYECLELETLDISNFNTSGVTMMRGIFNSCPKLKSLDVSSFDTSKVTTMKELFYSCLALESLDLTSFDTSNVTDMSGMFLSCRALESLDLSGFNTSNVTNMKQMFRSCLALKTLDLSGFDCAKVTDAGNLFQKWPPIGPDYTITCLKTPKNLAVDAPVPPGILWYDASTLTAYTDTKLPKNSESKTLIACAISQNIANGTVTVAPGEGPAVTVTVTPFTGCTYKDGSLAVTYNNGEEDKTIIPVATLNEGEYTFDMPAYPVTVTATFNITSWSALQNAIDAATKKTTFVLTEDLTAPSEGGASITIPAGKDIVLDLNGKVLNAGGKFGVITVKEGGTLTVIDSKPETEHKGYVDADGLWHLGDAPGGETEKTINGGIITGGYDINFGGVYVGNNGVLNMNGGSIVGNTSTGEGNVSGGGVSCQPGSSFTMTNSSIYGNVAASGAGGVYGYGSAKNSFNFTMTNSSICGNTCPDGAGGVCLGENANFTMINSSIADNVGGEMGVGGVFVSESSFTMTDSSITGNTGSLPGGVFVSDGSFTIINSRITDNTADMLGGGVVIIGEVVLGGTTVIKDNLVGETASNLVVFDFNPVTLGTKTASSDGNGVAAPADGMSVGVTITNDGTTPTAGAFTTNGTADDAKYFFSDRADYCVIFNTNHLELKEVHVVSTWSALQDAIDEATEPIIIKLTDDLKAPEQDGSSIVIPVGKNITIDLNGRKLDRGLGEKNPADGGNVITVLGEFTLQDSSVDKTGTITGGNNKAAGGGIYVCGGGKFTLESGKITENGAMIGGGVLVESGAEFIMIGGSVFGNTASTEGAGVYCAESITVTDGEITGNIAGNIGGGVCCAAGSSITVGGKAKITGNSASGAENNVYLCTGTVIGISDTALTNPAAVGVTAQTAFATITDNKATNENAGFFTSDNALYAVKFNKDHLELIENTDSWAVLQEKINSATAPITIKLNKDLTATDAPLTIPEGKTVTIDLNGFTLDRGLKEKDAEEYGNVITVKGMLTVTDSSKPSKGKITGGNSTEYRSGGVVVESGTFTLESGSICENKAANNGGGVLVLADATFIMKGGKIRKNSATNGGGGVFCNGTFTFENGQISENSAKSGAGVYVYASDDTSHVVAKHFTMTGGKIINNIASDKGGGIYADNYDIDVLLLGGEISDNTAGTLGGGVAANMPITVGGTVVVKYNTVNEKANNVYLRNVSKASYSPAITISTTTPLESGAYIRISGDATPVEFGTYASDCSSYFHPDDSKDRIKYVTKDKKLIMETIPTAAKIESDPETIYETLAEAIAAAQSGDTILLIDDITEGRIETGDKDLTFKPYGKNITVTITASMLFGANKSDKTFVLSGGDNGETLTIKPEKKENVNDFRPIAIRNGNTLVIKNGVILTGSNFNGKGGGMINVASNATLDMQGGIIEDCHIITDDYDKTNVQKGRGGAVYVMFGGKFLMSGGEIRNCSATVAGGAAYIAGTMEMSGGKISGCSVSGLDDGSGTVKAKGGAIYLYTSSVFTMTDGEISGNTLGDVEDMRGAGLYAATGVTFTKSGNAKIINNKNGKGNLSNTYLYDYPEAECTYRDVAAVPVNGKTYKLDLGDAYMGEFTFVKVQGGWLIAKESENLLTALPEEHNVMLTVSPKADYLSLSDGKLVYSDKSNATVWTYANGTFSAEVKTVQKTSGHWVLFIYVPGSTKTVTTTYYLSTVINGAILSTSPVEAELYQIVTGDNHEEALIDCGEYHKIVCTKCGKTLEDDVDHEFDDITHECECGAYDPAFKSVEVLAMYQVKTQKKSFGLIGRIFGINKSITTYTATVYAKATGMTVTKIEVSARENGGWTESSTFTSETQIKKFYTRITTSDGAKRLYMIIDGVAYPAN